MKTKPSRETLNQYVFDMGMDEAYAFFNLTSVQGNRIMFDKVSTKIPERYQWVEPAEATDEVPELSEDYNKLKNYICKNFKRILEKHRALDTKTIDARSMSPYDRAMEVLTDLLYYNADYVYVNDAETTAYITMRMKTGIGSLGRANRREEKLLELDEELDYSIYKDHSEEDVFNITKRLTRSQQHIVIELTKGYTQQELIDAYQIPQQTFNNAILKIQNKVENSWKK